jgi:hypothetical protein
MFLLFVFVWVKMEKIDNYLYEYVVFQEIISIEIFASLFKI